MRATAAIEPPLKVGNIPYDQFGLSTRRCFFQLRDDIPDRHSFPTRRSSDLWRPSRLTSRRSSGGRNTCLPELRTRSEEHTSELQSLRHLVCRLLLEKKK